MQIYAMYLAMILGITGFYYNSISTMRGKIISYEAWVFSGIFAIVYGILTNLVPLVFFSLICISLCIRGIYTHMTYSDIERAYTKQLLDLPKKQ